MRKMKAEVSVKKVLVQAETRKEAEEKAQRWGYEPLGHIKGAFRVVSTVGIFLNGSNARTHNVLARA